MCGRSPGVSLGSSLNPRLLRSDAFGISLQNPKPVWPQPSPSPKVMKETVAGDRAERHPRLPCQPTRSTPDGVPVGPAAIPAGSVPCAGLVRGCRSLPRSTPGCQAPMPSASLSTKPNPGMTTGIPITEGDERNRSRGSSGATSPVTMPVNQKHPGRGASGSPCDPCGIGSMCGLSPGVSLGSSLNPRLPCSDASGISLQNPIPLWQQESPSPKVMGEAAAGD
jgi:hypothetical protein